MYSRTPQIQLVSIVTADLSKYDRFSHFMGGARGKIQQASTKSLCCRVFTTFSILFSIGNALLDLPIKIWGVWNTVVLIFFTQVFFFLRRFIKMSQHCIQLHLCLLARSPVSLETVTKVTHFHTMRCSLA